METPPRATFRKAERLTGRKAIGELLDHGTTLSQAPLRMTWLTREAAGRVPARIAIAVPKKNFARAVDRNRIRRQLREVYRKNKQRLHALLSQQGLQAMILLVYSGKHLPEYGELETPFNRILTQLEKRLI